MPTTILEHIKGSDLPEVWQKKLQAKPHQTFTITVELEQEYIDEDMPPEEMISDELIEAVQRSEENYKGGRYTECKTEEEDKEFFKEVWNE